MELLVTNGHVSDTGREDIGYEMPPQMFTRLESGRWQELPNSSLGDYFEREHLGRALVTLDANLDGRTDVLITHLYEPVALLINKSETTSKSIGLRFQATSGHRDAIGSTVEVLSSGDKRTLQLTAGDGYMGSNERRLSFALSNASNKADIVVKWPSGLRQSFNELEAGRDYLLTEGIALPIPMNKHVQ